MPDPKLMPKPDPYPEKKWIHISGKAAVVYRKHKFGRTILPLPPPNQIFFSLPTIGTYVLIYTPPTPFPLYLSPFAYILLLYSPFFL